MKISAAPGELREGLFGQVVMWTFEILPWLSQQGIQPSWNICSKLYGLPPDYQIIPGIFNPTVPAEPAETETEMKLLELRCYACSILGGDYRFSSALWNHYFQVPPRIKARATNINLSQNVLGLHYRGTDKNRAKWDTNAVTTESFLTLTADFIERHPQIDSLFIATDEAAFINHAYKRFGALRIINLGVGEFHKRATDSMMKAENALLDAILLSHCRFVLQCNSALSAFAKVFNPDLEIYRVAASKLFGAFPYFPTAYIPVLTSENKVCQKILARQLKGDWTLNPSAFAKFGEPFGARARGPIPYGI